MSVPVLVIATKNRDKRAEMEAVLTELGLADTIADGLEWPEVEETGETLEENAVLKAETVALVTGLPAVADDTGLEVAALGGGPGVATARFAGPEATYQDNVELLLRRLEGEADRQAVFRTVVALAVPDGVVAVAAGVLEGSIAAHPRGQFGFGYDPVFEVGGRTLAEMGEREKNQLSHRALALRALAKKL